MERRRPRWDSLPKRFLFLFSDTGGGHRASAQAVADEMKRLYRASAAVEVVDIFVEMGQWPFHRFPDWYPSVVGLNGIPWSVGFRLSDRVNVMKTMSRLVWPYVRSATCDVLCRYPADVIVSFHPIPNYALALALRRMGWRTPLAIVAVDLVTIHAGWVVPGAHLYLLASEAAKARSLRWGVPERRAHVVGMPTRRAFVAAMNVSKQEARARLQLPQEPSIVLMVGGGEGMGPLVQVVRAIGRRRPAAHLVAIAGRNNALQQELSELRLPVPLQVEGFVSNMELWMRAADILVTKAGPNTLCEAFITGLPMVLYTALPGQEEGNVTHVVDNGAGMWAPTPRLAASAVQRLLSDPQMRQRMAECSHTLARPQATEMIAQKLWSLASATQWIVTDHVMQASTRVFSHYHE